MAELKTHTEPSMEEILASIRRIIAEDDSVPTPAPAAPIAAAAALDQLRPVAPAPPPAAYYARPSAPPPEPADAAIGDGEAFRVAGIEPVVVRSFPPVPPSVVPPRPVRPPPVQEAILDLTERVEPEEFSSRAAGTMPNPAPPLGTPLGSGLGSGRLNRPPPLKAGAGAPEPLMMGDTPPRRASIAASVATLQQIASINQSARQPELPLGDVGRTLEEMVRELLRPHLKEWLDAHLPRLVERMVKDEINRLVREAQEG